MASSCAVVKQSIGLSIFTTTDRPSFATCTFAKLIPFSAHSAASSSLIKREASLPSVSPLQNFSNPPPVPEVATETCTPGFSAMKSSAATSE